MDSIRIKKVEVSNAGPVDSFSWEFAPLTLIYGPNESGKTTLLSNMVNTLFSASARKPVIDERGKAFAGFTRIALDTPLGERVLEPGDRGLLSLLPETLGSHPADLYRLLYVRAGDTRIEPGGGVSRTLVKGLVSNQQVYDRIRDFVPNEAGYTEIEGGVLTGNKQGMMKKLIQARGRYGSLLEIAAAFRESQSGAGMARLRREETALCEAVAEQERACRFRAYSVSEKLAAVETERDALDPRKIRSLEKAAYEYDDALARADAARARMKEHAGSEKKQKWLASARIRYLELSGGGPVSGARWHLPAVMALIAAAGGAAFLHGVAAAVLAAIAIGVAGMKLVTDRSAAKRDGLGNESAIEEIRRDFVKQFGHRPSSIADFDTALSDLQESLADYRAAARDLESAERTAADCSRQLDTGIADLLPGGRGRKEYASAIAGINAAREKLDKNWNSLNTELAVLGVEEADYLRTDPETAYSFRVLEKSQRKLADIREQIRALEEEYTTLRARISGELGGALPPDPGAVADALEEARAAAEEEVLDLSARLYAAVLVRDSLESFIEAEDRLVEGWLETAGIGAHVKALTGRYDRIAFEEEELMVGNARERYPLASLSSGAIEQVLLALRMGIAPAVTGQNAMFLLLDDAFQFSDWKRRDHLVQAVGAMIENGWQVVYFSMDDDIRNRLSGLGKKLGKGRFTEIELG